jgi:hypothetical protein
VFNYGVFNAAGNGNGTFLLSTAGTILTGSSAGVLVPAACPNTTISARLIGAFTGNYTMTLMKNTAANMSANTYAPAATSATCAVSGGGTRSCTSSSVSFAAGDFLQVQIVGDTAFNAVGNTAGAGNFLAAQVSCQ